MQPLRAFSKLIAATIAAISACSACSLFYPSVQAGPTFQVEVKDQGRPIKGLRVELSSDQSSNNRSVSATDANGLALFRSVRPGSNHLSADHDAGISDGADVQVKRGGPTDVTVRLKWPNSAPMVVRSLKGILRGPDYPAGQSQPRLSLDLLEATSGRLLKSIQTADSGEFNFEGVASGLYFLSLRPSGVRAWSGEQITGPIAIAVDQAAPTDYLDIDFGWSSCGLWYWDQNQCPHPNLRIAYLSGQVLSVGEAAIPGATILLFDHARKLIDRVKSDSAGKFASPHSLSGKYELSVSAPGFNPFRTNADLKPTGDLPRRSSLTIRLALGDVCSSAESQ